MIDRNHVIFTKSLRERLSIILKKVFRKVVEDDSEKEIILEIVCLSLMLGEKRNTFQTHLLTQKVFNKRCLGISRELYKLMGKFDNGKL